jgi:hypothetical protein
MLTTLCALAFAADPPLRHLGTYASGVHDASASEIAAYHAPTRTLYVVNGAAGLDLIDIRDPARPVRRATRPMQGATSVAVHGDIVAVAVPDPKGGRGSIRLLDPDGVEQSMVTVGHGPDMCTFSRDGSWLVVADEGEASDSADPDGSVTVIGLGGGDATVRINTAGFDAFDADAAGLEAGGAHLPVPGAPVRRQLEPEYVSIAPDGRTAIVSLQEANAVAVVDLASATVTRVHGLGLKDFARSSVDASASDAAIAPRPWPVHALRQPDSVVSWEHGGTTWFAVTEEGEWREGPSFDERAKVAALKLDPALAARCAEVAGPGADPKAAALLGELTVSRPASDRDGDGVAERLVAFGGRGVSIWELRADGIALAWDSGDLVERTVAREVPAIAKAADARSPSRGPEPEGLAIGEVDGRRLLFCGLERTGGIMAWDVTDPRSPALLGSVHRRDPAIDAKADLAAAGDVGPEGLLFIAAKDSPNGRPMLVVCNEVSGTTTLWEVVAPPR